MNSLYVKIAVIVIIIVVLIIVYKKAKDKIQQRKAAKEFEKDSIGGVVGGQSYSLNPATVATEIYNAFHEYWGMEDEEAAILAINNVPKQFVPMVSKAYFTLYKLALNNEFSKYLSPAEYAQVRNQFN